MTSNVAGSLWHYRATMVRVVDGDTFDAEVQLGFYTYRLERFRLLGSSEGIDAPEMNDKDPAVRAQAVAAKNRVAELLPVDAEFFIVTDKPGPHDPRDGFGRFLSQAILPDQTNVGDLLLAEGLAVPYVRGK